MKRRELRFAVGADKDLLRLFRFLARHDHDRAAVAIGTIQKALEMATLFPFSCRKEIATESFSRV
jgi:plasmid stabilization system protein ParE